MSDDISKDVINLEAWGADSKKALNPLPNESIYVSHAESNKRILVLIGEIRRLQEDIIFREKAFNAINNQITRPAQKDLYHAVNKIGDLEEQLRQRDELIAKKDSALEQILRCDINQNFGCTGCRDKCIKALNADEALSSSEALYDKPHKNEIYGKADRQDTITCKHGVATDEKCIVCGIKATEINY